MDIVVFCLSLMGSNLSDYLCEANRILKKKWLFCNHCCSFNNLFLYLCILCSPLKCSSLILPLINC